jgi:methionyl-tRNA synthetase
VLVAVAWPYANGLSHLGHIAGAYLPADIFARYHRIVGNRVLMVSGTDAHGTPITVLADQEGVTPAQIVDRFNPRFHEQWERLGISFDLFTTTMTDNHREVTWEILRGLRDHGYLEARTTEQFYDPVAERFLPDRYVEGTCPNCGADNARGDQCDTCGKTLDPVDLIDPRSKLTGATPEQRPTEHHFILLSKLQQDVCTWLEGREGWRNHVINWALGFVKEGLHDRAITRDLSWGVPLPPDAGLDAPNDKRIYVWFEAVIGYLSASKEWAQQQGDPEAWRAWWEDPAAESYYFVGKDNIPFHAVYWPAQLMGSGELNLPTNVPANQYVTFKGAKASKSFGVGRAALDYLEIFEPDALRYGLATNLPEYNDVDLTDEELVRRVNDELVATWGNLVNRVFAMTRKNHGGVVPEPGPLEDRDRRAARDHRPAPGRGGRPARAGRAAAGPEGGDGRGAGRQRLPQRHGAVADRQDRPGADRHHPVRRPAGDRRADDGVRAVRAVRERDPGRLVRLLDAAGGWGLAAPRGGAGYGARRGPAAVREGGAARRGGLSRRPSTSPVRGRTRQLAGHLAAQATVQGVGEQPDPGDREHRLQRLEPADRTAGPERDHHELVAGRAADREERQQPADREAALVGPRRCVQQLPGRVRLVADVGREQQSRQHRGDHERKVRPGRRLDLPTEDRVGDEVGRQPEDEQRRGRPRGGGEPPPGAEAQHRRSSREVVRTR